MQGPINTKNPRTTSFNDFCKLNSIKYWREQLSDANVKNIKNESQLGGTRNTYTYGLLIFHNWLTGRRFQHTLTVPVEKNMVQQYKTTIRLTGVEHLLDLSKNNIHNKTDFTHLIREYLAELSSAKKPSMVKNSMYAIRSFFRENQADITFQFRHRIRRKTESRMTVSLSLDDLQKILTIPKIQPIESAVFLCKFQRGLDSSTLADRFNFEAWPSLIKHFGSDDPESWDLTNTPVPISLARVKTGFMHTGFLDVDAIEAIIQYLKTRHDKPETNKPLFIDTRKKPITTNWISRRFHKLVIKYHRMYNTTRFGIPNRCTSHELRDLLKSTLIDSGCRTDVADHVIGHAPKDSYEKQILLYPESTKLEFMKASERINILSNSRNITHVQCPKTSQNNIIRQKLPTSEPIENHLRKLSEKIEGLERICYRMVFHMNRTPDSHNILETEPSDQT